MADDSEMGNERFLHFDEKRSMIDSEIGSYTSKSIIFCV